MKKEAALEKKEMEASLKSSPSARREFHHFLDLRAEIRLIIYDMVLWSPWTICPQAKWVLFFLRDSSLFCISANTGKWNRNTDEEYDTGLLLVSRQVSKEACERFYRINAWSFHGFGEWPKPENAVSKSLNDSTMLVWYGRPVPL